MTDNTKKDPRIDAQIDEITRAISGLIKKDPKVIAEIWARTVAFIKGVPYKPPESKPH